MARKPTETFAKTQAGAARLLGITTRTLRTWATESWFPKSAHSAKGWNVTKLKAAREVEDRKGSTSASEDRAIRQDERRARIEKLKTEQKLRQLEFDEACGLLIHRDAIEPQITLIYTTLVELLRQMPMFLEPSVKAGDVAGFLKRFREEGDAYLMRLRADSMRIAAKIGKDFKL